MQNTEDNTENIPEKNRRSFDYTEEETEIAVNRLIDAHIFGQEILPGLLGQKLT